METRSKLCLQCSSEFSYSVGKGRDRKHCSDACRLAHQRVRKAEQYASLPSCKVTGCSGRATRVSAGMCERHYCCVRRTGSTRPKLPRIRKLHGGYVRMRKPGHALADSAGGMYAHRYVAYETHSGECPHCFWCSARLDWSVAVVDHLNEDKTDNRPENLVVSCNGCNRARGALLPFIARMTDTAWPAFIAQAERYRMISNDERNSF